VARYQQKKAQLQDEIENLNREIDELKKQRQTS
jgi:prefoldin subunit 5